MILIRLLREKEEHQNQKRNETNKNNYLST
jgi:hypothetical protein